MSDDRQWMCEWCGVPLTPMDGVWTEPNGSGDYCPEGLAVGPTGTSPHLPLLAPGGVNDMPRVRPPLGSGSISTRLTPDELDYFRTYGVSQLDARKVRRLVPRLLAMLPMTALAPECEVNGCAALELGIEPSSSSGLREAAQAVVDAAGTNGWPVNLDRLRAAIER